MAHCTENLRNTQACHFLLAERLSFFLNSVVTPGGQNTQTGFIILHIWHFLYFAHMCHFLYTVDVWHFLYFVHVWHFLYFAHVWHFLYFAHVWHFLWFARVLTPFTL